MDLQYCNIKDQAGALSRAFVLGLREAFGVRSFVETGTYLGDTLATLCNDFDSLQSIELSEEYHARAKARFAGQPQIQLIHADSTAGLATAIGRLSTERAIFWLDAHYSGGDTVKGHSNTPVESELRIILANPQRNDIILVDDLRYFWRARPGFLTHDALLGYPSVEDIVRLLNSGAHRYDCFALSDALIAIPSDLRGSYVASPLLRALTRSREGVTAESGLDAIEKLISQYTGPELSALNDIPDYLVSQSEYGLGGHYFYWRALAHLGRKPDMVLADIEIAARCGVIPDGSILAPFKTLPPEDKSGGEASIANPVKEAAAPRSGVRRLASKLKSSIMAGPRKVRTKYRTFKMLVALERRVKVSAAQARGFNSQSRDEWVADRARSVAPGSRVLDVGAGTAPYRSLFAHCTYETQDFVKYDGFRGPEGQYSDIDYESDITEIPVGDATFDVVLCTEVLEHVPRPIEALREMVRITKPGGRLFVTAPLGSGLHQEPYHFYGGYTDHWYRKFLTEFGCEVVSIEPNHGFFAHLGQECARFAEQFHRLKTEYDGYEAELTRMMGDILPRFFYELDKKLPMREFTVGFHVEAKRNRESPPSGASPPQERLNEQVTP